MIYKNCIKRVLDILISLILIVPILIICCIVGMLIKIEDSGTIFYKQKRLGIHMKPYSMYKLRSMKMNAPDLRNADGSTFNSDEDPRLLKVGKFIRKTSIDELPQIFNVLMGTMSLIGPRPDLESQGVLYEQLNKDKTKFDVKPGITGYAQCNGRNEIDWDEKLKLDHYYVDHCSFMLDVKIIFKTLISVICRKGINKNDNDNKRRI